MVWTRGTRDAAANLEDVYAKVLQEHPFERSVGCPCSIYSRERGIRIVVRGDDFLSGGLKHELKWMKSIMNKHFESKHIMMGASSDLGKSLVILNQEDRLAG